MSIDIRVRTRRSRPIGASIVPDSAGGRPFDEREVLAAHRPRRERRLQRAVHLLRLRDDEQARRLAVQAMDDPGARGVLAASDAARERLRERALPVPAGGVHDDARRLVDDDEVLVLVRDVERRGGDVRPGVLRRASTARRRRRRAPRPRTRWPLRATVPSTSTAPASIRRAARERDPSGCARNASSRSPAASAGTSSCIAALDDEEEDDDADRDRRVGDVERRPVRELDEVDDRALARRGR